MRGKNTANPQKSISLSH